METDERYEIVDESHGKGGFGKVSKQRDKFLDRFVAVKQLHLIDDKEAKARFEREARTLARMSHPNVPAIYDVKFYGDSMHVYFEFLDGQTLSELIAQGAYPSMQDGRNWYLQIASALQHAHDLGIVHRDVKPGNIIVSEDRRTAYLVDFGIALTAADVKRITKSGYAIGTPGYMSPEQMAGKEVDGRADLYSLGVSLYETLCGQMPQPGEYRKLSKANESIPPAIDDLIKECLEPEKNRRIESAIVFSKHLVSAFRTDVPLSKLLTDARLHELHGALSTMSAEEFHSKPRGQKLLIINRLKDLMRTDRQQLFKATADLIALLVRIGRFESAQDYRVIADAALEWGFDKMYGESWRGEQDIRDASIHAGKAAEGDGLRVLARAFIDFVPKKDLREQPGWYLHDLRLIVMALLANPKCGDEATQLASIYDSVNEASHSETRDTARVR